MSDVLKSNIDLGTNFDVNELLRNFKYNQQQQIKQIHGYICEASNCVHEARLKLTAENWDKIKSGEDKGNDFYVCVNHFKILFGAILPDRNKILKRKEFEKSKGLR